MARPHPAASRNRSAGARRPSASAGAARPALASAQAAICARPGASMPIQRLRSAPSMMCPARKLGSIRCETSASSVAARRKVSSPAATGAVQPAIAAASAGAQPSAWPKAKAPASSGSSACSAAGSAAYISPSRRPQAENTSRAGLSSRTRTASSAAAAGRLARREAERPGIAGGSASASTSRQVLSAACGDSSKACGSSIGQPAACIATRASARCEPPTRYNASPGAQCHSAASSALTMPREKRTGPCARKPGRRSVPNGRLAPCQLRPPSTWISSRLPPPRSATTPLAPGSAPITPIALVTASCSPDSSRGASPSARTRARKSSPLVASRAAAVATVSTLSTPRSRSSRA